MRSRQRRVKFTEERGLSLVELLMAITIITVAMLGIVGMFPIAHQHLRAGGELTVATGLAQRMAELLRDEPVELVPRYHNADTRVPASFPADDTGGGRPFRGGSALTQWREEVAAARLLGGVNQGWGRIQVVELDRGWLSVTVTVGWPAGPTERTVQLASYICQQ